MVLGIRSDATDAQIDRIREYVESNGLCTRLVRQQERTVIGCFGAGAPPERAALLALPGVESVARPPKPYRLAARDYAEGGTLVRLGDAAETTIGAGSVVVIAGPCSVEGRDMLLRTAGAVRAAGASILRGGAFKPRTSPYAFQGLGRPGLELLAEARGLTGMPVVTEVLDTRHVDLVAAHADILQVGARNMQNFALLSAVGEVHRPVLLKRGASATVHELLLAAEYIMARGCRDVILCERGIRTFENATRNTLDVAAIPVLRSETHLPVLVDPSHAAGRADLVAPLACAAVAAGADGLIIEVHPDPAAALSDGDQSLAPPEFARLMQRLRPVCEAVGRTLASSDARDAEIAA
jgi:3-deoxy-7-phosphoheptulonate synthase